jgi:hypothetical protein
MEKISLKWMNEQKTILLISYVDEKWTWDDVTESVRCTNAMIDGVGGVVDVIIDMRGHRALPNGGSPFKTIEFVRISRHPRQNCIVVVGLRGAIAKLAEFMQRIPDPNPRTIHIVNSLDEALNLLKNKSSP